MKKYGKYLMILTAGLLTACSDMGVNEDKAVAENFPEGFSASEYAELHPALISLQVQDFVAAKNASFTDSVEKAKDSVAFFENKEMVHKIFVDPKLAGFTEADWEDTWMDLYITAYDTVVTGVDTTQIKFETTGEKKTVISVYFPTKISLDEEGKTVVSATGYTDSSKTTEITLTVNDTLTFVTKRGGITADTTRDITSRPDTIPGGFDKNQLRYLSKFNIYGELNDYELLTAEAGAPDLDAAKYQYLAYGKGAGWAYRKCGASEASNPEQDEVKSDVLYCDDNGIVREIK